MSKLDTITVETVYRCVGEYYAPMDAEPRISYRADVVQERYGVRVEMSPLSPCSYPWFTIEGDKAETVRLAARNLAAYILRFKGAQFPPAPDPT